MGISFLYGNGYTVGRTDGPSYKDARPHLKTTNSLTLLTLYADNAIGVPRGIVEVRDVDGGGGGGEPSFLGLGIDMEYVGARGEDRLLAHLDGRARDKELASERWRKVERDSHSHAWRWGTNMRDADKRNVL